MPREQHPEPFWRQQTQCYYVQIGKKQHRLSKDKDEAWRLYHEMMSKPPEVRPEPSAGDPPLAVEVLDAFLDWCEKNNAPRTYAWYRENLQRFVSAIPAKIAVTDLKPYHITRALAGFPNWSNNTKHDFISAVKRGFNWAADEEMIERSPLFRVKKPARKAREMAVSPAEYTEVITAIQEPNFRDLIELSWETGARVQELRKIEARFLDLDTSRVVFPPKLSKGKKYHRVIYLTGRAQVILRRLAETHLSGELLRNSEGNPWTKDAINCAFCRLQIALGRRALDELGIAAKVPPRFKKAGIAPGRQAEARAAHRAKVRKCQKEKIRLAREHGKKYHLGAFRKGYATEALKEGVDTVTVAHLLGHRDPSMVSKVYGHVQQDPEHMARAANKAKGIKAGGGA